MNNEVQSAIREVDSTIHLPPNTEKFPKLGIKVSFLIKDFIGFCGGKDKLEGKTTENVVEEIIKPATAKYQTSFCEMLLNQGKELGKERNEVAVARATVFISQARKYTFLKVLSAIENHFEGDNLDTFIWFDIFSLNQHQANNFTSEWLRTLFKNTIGEFGRTVMVLSPWNNPITYTRAWCIWEAYCTVVTKGKFEIAVSSHDRDIFINEITANPIGVIDEMLSKIDAEKSECFDPKEKEIIFDTIRKEIGFPKINPLIYEQLRIWVINEVNKELENNQDESRHPFLLRTLGKLYIGQGKYQDSSRLLQEAFDTFTQYAGDRHPETLITMHDLGYAYFKEGKYNIAEDIFLNCLEKQNQVFEPNHPLIRSTTNSLGLVYERQDKFKMAEEMYLECLEKAKLTVGNDHPSILACNHNLALLYERQEKFNITDKMSIDNFEKQKEVLGSNHPDTLRSMAIVAKIYGSHGDFNKAKLLYNECIEKKTVALGPDHPSTLLSNYSFICHQLLTYGDFDNYENFTIRLVEKLKSSLGPDHPNTLTVVEDLSFIHKRNYKAE